MNYGDFIQSRSEESEGVLPLRIEFTPENMVKAQAFWNLASQALKQGIREPEISKVLDICNQGEFFDVERAIDLLTDKSLKVYEAQRDCECMITTPNVEPTVIDPLRCENCGAFLLKDKIGVEK